MYRTINVHADKFSQSGAGKIPSFPAAFTTGAYSFSLSINSVLLIISYLIAPASVTGVSLAEFWAWVRYSTAIVPRDRNLHLTRSYADLGTHQKAILSDDFEMGVPMIWLMKNLPPIDIVDDRCFSQRYGANHGAYQHCTTKRGSNKTPNFVVQGHDGEWHILGCKGT